MKIRKALQCSMLSGVAEASPGHPENDSAMVIRSEADFAILVPNRKAAEDLIEAIREGMDVIWPKETPNAPQN